MDKLVMIITGASSGIGAETARRMARDGVRLTLAARRLDRLQAVAQEVEQLGGEALVVQTDVTQDADLQHMIDATLERWGRVDVLLNNAGVGEGGPLAEKKEQDVRQAIAINLIGVIESTRLMLPVMLRQKSGHIINLSSLSGLVASPGVPIYCATKFGVVGFSDALRRDLRGTGVHVSLFCPGFTPSEIDEGLKAHVDGLPDAPRIPGLMPTSYVADQIARLVYHPRRMTVVPKSWRPLPTLAYLFPWLADLLVRLFWGKEK
jgi:short-subunit dehydrogenase